MLSVGSWSRHPPSAARALVGLGRSQDPAPSLPSASLGLFETRSSPAYVVILPWTRRGAGRQRASAREARMAAALWYRSSGSVRSALRTTAFSASGAPGRLGGSAERMRASTSRARAPVMST